MKNYHISVICQKRTKHVSRLVDSLIATGCMEQFHITFYIDSIEKYSSKYDEILTSFLENKIDRNIFKSYNIFYQDHSLGTWNSKLFALYDSVSRGSDLTLLLEDDLVLKRDALQFVIQADNFLEKRGYDIYCISLFSYNLINSRLSFNKAKTFFEANKGYLLSLASVNNYPTPWGIAYPQKLINYLRDVGWNGNDQSLVALFKSENIVNIYPTLTRSFHQGEIGVSGNLMLPHQQLDLVNENVVSEFDFSSIDDNFNIVNAFYDELLNDQNIKQHTFYLIYDHDSNNDLHDDVYKLYGLHMHKHMLKDVGGSPDIPCELDTKLLSIYFLLDIQNDEFLKKIISFLEERNFHYVIVENNFIQSLMELLS